jgi:hypothetical protein
MINRAGQHSGYWNYLAVRCDPAHWELLRKGPRAWNAWREEDNSIVPNLTGITLGLSELQLAPINGGPINLGYAKLEGASLRFANLSLANLEAADLMEADLTHARLNGANLTYSILSKAVLHHTDLAGAKLMKANLCETNLSTVKNLTQRQLFGTFGNLATILPIGLNAPESWSA